MHERNRLLTMLSEHKINEHDFKILYEALNKKASRVYGIFTFAMNPFQKIAGLPALGLGFIVILLLSFLGTIAKVYFPGIFSCLNAYVVKNASTPLSFQILLFQNLISWGILSALFIISSFAFKQKRLRIVDFLGTTALARFPFLFLTGYIAIIQKVDPNFMAIDLEKGLEFHFTLPMILFMIVVLLSFSWQAITYFFAFKESSGLISKKLWIGFIASVVLGELISNVATMALI